ncbi:signal peptide peptidase SppA [uncultured Cytophaga sp.]|uniref:signal peptide peptidase SppA n=1 Tax=uncultured Cytophaga sp. TaxID=160238 RepID=UPI00260BB388|nr:signal peptide peptidase SppA [uncultured Cytophaga sp.]
MSFIKNVFAVIVGFILLTIIGIVIVVAMVSSGKEDETSSLKDNSVLKITLDNEIVERESDKLFSGLLDPRGASSKIGLLELKKAIQEATTNDKIKGIYIEFKFATAGIATWKELRDELVEFKKSGKFVVTYGEMYTEAAYYLASVADEIYLPESGMLEFNGIGVNMMYFKNLLSKIGVKTEVFRVGKYKSAIEPLVNDHMSDADREQVHLYINSLYSVMLEDIAVSRNIPLETLKNISDSMLVRNARDARELGLISHEAYFDQLILSIKSKLKLEDETEINFISYKKLIQFNKDKIAVSTEPHIAVLFANGEIQSGKGDGEVIGSETICADLRKLREDENVKAIVLRINSPGGSALASDIIWREIILTREVKPVIASMANVAASGGYYIAMACDTIVASPATITGSIGVFGLLMNTEDLLNNKLGINTDSEKTGLYSDIGSLTRPVTDGERAIIQNEVNSIYATFIQKAALGRHTTVEEIEEKASGRVWAGKDAKVNNLIDVFGGMNTAIGIAAKRAKLADGYKLVYYPEQKNQAWIEFFNSFSGEEDAKMKTFGAYYAQFKTLQSLPKYQGVQARIPYFMDIK